MREVVVIGVGMTRFGKYMDKSLKDLGREVCWDAKDAGILQCDPGWLYGEWARRRPDKQTLVLVR